MERVSIDWAFLTISNSSPRRDGEGVGRRIFYSVPSSSLSWLENVIHLAGGEAKR